jgi:predicted RNase H-like nuclease (RuvC/YqgF family)
VATHLEQQAARRHEEYQKAEIVELKRRLAEAETRIEYVLRRLAKLEDMVGIPGE